MGKWASNYINLHTQIGNIGFKLSKEMHKYMALSWRYDLAHSMGKKHVTFTFLQNSGGNQYPNILKSTINHIHELTNATRRKGQSYIDK